MQQSAEGRRRRAARRVLEHPVDAAGVAWERIARTARRVPDRLRFGSEMPRYGERIWIDPAQCTQVVTPIIGHHRSGTVEPGGWDTHTRPLESIHKLTACVAHFADGVPWAETGIFEHMMDAIADHGETDGCRDLEDVRRRYRQLDQVYETVRLEGRLRTRFELGSVRRSWSEVGGVFVHVGRDLSPIFGRGGVHRLAISRVLRLERIPAQVGVVHAHAVERWRDELDGGAPPS